MSRLTITAKVYRLAPTEIHEVIHEVDGTTMKAVLLEVNTRLLKARMVGPIEADIYSELPIFVPGLCGLGYVDSEGRATQFFFDRIHRAIEKAYRERGSEFS